MWWKYFSLAIFPVLIGFIAALVWAILGSYLSVSKSDAGVFESVFGVIGIAHGLIASMQISKGYEHKSNFDQAWDSRNAECVIKYSRIKIDPAIMFLLFFFSVVFFIMFLFYPFETYKAGIVAVWTTVSVLYLIWKVAHELFDPFEGIEKRTPEEVEARFDKATREKIFGERQDALKISPVVRLPTNFSIPAKEPKKGHRRKLNKVS